MSQSISDPIIRASYEQALRRALVREQARFKSFLSALALEPKPARHTRTSTTRPMRDALADLSTYEDMDAC